MSHLKWNQSLSTGLAHLDDQHKRLIFLANNLVEALHTADGHPLIITIFNELREYTVYHFDDEERYMAGISYPDRVKHQGLHATIRAELKTLQKRLRAESPPPSKEVLLFMKRWLVDHIIAEDGKIGKFVREEKSKENTAH